MLRSYSISRFLKNRKRLTESTTCCVSTLKTWKKRTTVRMCRATVCAERSRSYDSRTYDSSQQDSWARMTYQVIRTYDLSGPKSPQDSWARMTNTTRGHMTRAPTIQGSREAGLLSPRCPSHMSSSHTGHLGTYDSGILKDIWLGHLRLREAQNCLQCIIRCTGFRFFRHKKGAKKKVTPK